MTRIIILTISLFAVCFQLSAQSLRAYEVAAKSASEANDFVAALGYYKIIIEEAGDNKIDNFFLAAEAARKAKVFDRAEAYYQYVVANSEDKAYSSARYHLAEVQKCLGKYKEAGKNFSSFASNNSANTTGLVENAQKEVEMCAWAEQVVRKADKTKLNHLDDKVNSGYADFAPFFKDGNLYYSTLRNNSGELEAGPAIGKIMFSHNEEQGVSLKGNINDKINDVVNANFSADGMTMHYTICENISESGKRCDIYVRTKKGDDWGDAVKLPSSINNKNSNNTHPNFGEDAQGNKYLFFSSDRKGGKGGMDIYYSELNGSEYGDPVNLDVINSEGDDVTPFYHARSRKLYYSTNGLKSLGGLDIYASRKSNGEFAKPVHGGYPLNSSLDDAYFTLNQRGDVGYFSSNRPGAFCLDSLQNCVCSDIYESNRPVIDLVVKTYNSITKEPLNGTEVTLLPKQYDPETLLDENSNEYYYGLDFENGYDIKGSKEGYSGDNEVAETFDAEGNITIEKDLFLRPNVDLSALVFDERTGEPLKGVKVELVSLDENGVIDSRVEVDKNNFDFPLDWKKRYQVIASKDGYISDTVDVVTNGIPIVPTALSENLFLCRQPFDNYPFLSLYFDNDYPKMIGKDKSVANGDYATNFKEYANQSKRAEFIGVFNNEADRQTIKDFFGEVDEGFVRLERFAKNLQSVFSDPENKDSVIVTLKGYASPRSTPEYNQLLTQRRINSLEQYLEQYGNGSLKPYVANRQIQIIREPYGENRAKGGSEDFNNRKASVYAVDASRERRLEIIRVTTSKYVCKDENSNF